MLGKSFGALDGDGKAPTYVHHLDNAYITWSLYGLNPWLYRLFEYLPIKPLQEFMAAGDYVYKVRQGHVMMISILLASGHITNCRPCSTATMPCKTTSVAMDESQTNDPF